MGPIFRAEETHTEAKQAGSGRNSNPGSCARLGGEIPLLSVLPHPSMSSGRGIWLTEAFSGIKKG